MNVLNVKAPNVTDYEASSETSYMRSQMGETASEQCILVTVTAATKSGIKMPTTALHRYDKHLHFIS